MAADGQVHWEEGLFLQPQHLQWMQRHILDRFARERRFLRAYPYGVLEMQISDDELSDFRVRFERLHAVMPSGLEIRVPGDADLPSLDIKERFAASSGALTVSLGVPLWYESRRNVVEAQSDEPWRARQLYRVVEVERTDENTGENPQPIRVRRINARLLLNDDDRSDLEVLPLLKLVPSPGEEVGLPRRDSAYIPPCLSVGGSPVLTELLRDMAGQVMATRSELVPEITRGGFSVDNLRGRQFEQLIRLQTLSRFGPVLDSFRQVPGTIAPFDMYVLLRQLHGELAALQPDRDLFDVREYDHENAWAVFSELAQKIRSLLMGTAPPKFLKVQLDLRDDLRCVGASLTEEHFSLPNGYFLAVDKTRMDPKQLVPLVENRDQFKVMPPSLFDKPIYGVKLEYEAYPPVELPAGGDRHYFRLNRAESARMWSRIEQEKAVAVRWPDMESSGFDLALYMTIP